MKTKNIIIDIKKRRSVNYRKLDFHYLNIFLQEDGELYQIPKVEETVIGNSLFKGCIINGEYVAYIINNSVKPDLKEFEVERVTETTFEADTYTVKETLNLKSEDRVLTASIVTTYTKETKEVVKSVLYNYGLSEEDLFLILDALDEIGRKVLDSDYVFSLLSEEFSIGELKQVVELLSDKKYSTANFTRIYLKYLKSTDLISRGKGHNPAKLYTFNNNWEIEDKFKVNQE